MEEVEDLWFRPRWMIRISRFLLSPLENILFHKWALFLVLHYRWWNDLYWALMAGIPFVFGLNFGEVWMHKGLSREKENKERQPYE